MIIDDYDDSPKGFLFRYITMRCTGYFGRMSFVTIASNSIPSSGALNASSSVTLPCEIFTAFYYKVVGH